MNTEKGETIEIAPENYGAIILAPTAFSDYCNSLAVQLENEVEHNFGKGLLYDLVGSKERVAHITLFQGGFPEGQRSEIHALLKSLSASLQPLTIQMESRLVVHPYGPIFWNAIADPKLTDLHGEVLEALLPLTRVNKKRHLMKQWADRLRNSDDLTPEQREMVLQNGFAESGQLFVPHITLGRVDRSDEYQAVRHFIENFSVQPKQFVVENIAMGRLGYAGNVEEVIT